MKKIIKKIMIGCFVLYGYNYIAVNFNMVLPINYFNVIVLSFLGPFGLCGLVFFKFFVLWGFYERSILY